MTKYWLLYLLAAYLIELSVEGLLREQKKELLKQNDEAWDKGFDRGVVACEREIQRPPKRPFSPDIQTGSDVRQYSSLSN